MPRLRCFLYEFFDLRLSRLAVTNEPTADYKLEFFAYWRRNNHDNCSKHPYERGMLYNVQIPRADRGQQAKGRIMQEV